MFRKAKNFHGFGVFVGGRWVELPDKVGDTTVGVSVAIAAVDVISANSVIERGMGKSNSRRYATIG